MVVSSKTYRQELEDKYRHLLSVNPDLNRKLVSFQANKNTPIYNWFAYKEGFSYQMVRTFIEKYPHEIGTVFDPFSGVNTTLFTASELGYDSLGIELLPIGEFVLQSRTAASRIKVDKLKEVVKNLKSMDFLHLPTGPATDYKHVRITKKAFPEKTERKVNAYRKYVQDKIDDKNIRQMLTFACLCILEKISYTRKDGQYLRWDRRAKKSKTTFDKGRIYTFEEALFSTLEQILADLRGSRLFVENSPLGKGKIKLKTGTCLKIMPSLPDESFDLIISSPPYCNRYDYTRTYALELVFLGADEDEIKRLRQSMLSCTVENKDKKELLQEIYAKNGQISLFTACEEAFKGNKALQEVISILGDYKEQGSLNNPGIYSLVRNYFYEHTFVVFQMARLLKRGRRIYYVNDNVRYAGETIPVDLILSEFAEKAGLEVKTIFVLQAGKGNSSQQMGLHGREELRKCVYCWEKP